MDEDDSDNVAVPHAANPFKKTTGNKSFVTGDDEDTSSPVNEAHARLLKKPMTKSTRKGSAAKRMSVDQAEARPIKKVTKVKPAEEDDSDDEADMHPIKKSSKPKPIRKSPAAAKDSEDDQSDAMSVDGADNSKAGAHPAVKTWKKGKPAGKKTANEAKATSKSKTKEKESVRGAIASNRSSKVSHLIR